MIRTSFVSFAFAVGKMVSLAMVFFVGLIELAGAACLQNKSNRTVYVTLSSSHGQKIGNLTIGERSCLKVDKGQKAMVKIVPYGGARFGCKSEIKSGRISVLVKFGTMNNCSFEPGN